MRRQTLANLVKTNDGTKIRPMTDSESRLFLTLMFQQDVVGTPEELRAGLVEKFGKDAEIFQLSVMLQRLEYARPIQSYSLHSILFVCDISDRVGVVVQWAYTLFEETRKAGQVVDMKLLADLFPNGFPTSSGYEEVWDEQKIGGANWLDLPEAFHVADETVTDDAS